MTDFVVIGGGIAGVAAAAHLAPHGSVTLVEAETALAYHTTGRSAALFLVNYGSAASRAFATASRLFLEYPDDGLVDAPLLTERGLMWIANEAQVATVKEIGRQGQQSDTGNRWLTAAEALELVPVLRRDVVAGALYEPEAFDIDVAGLHQAFVRLARRRDATIRTEARATAIERDGNGWAVTVGGETISCGSVINAAGAWGDSVATLAGVKPIGLRPMRRTAFMVPGDPQYSDWPMVVEGGDRFYFKPDGGQLFCSLSEENADQPSDVRPRMEDVALAIERINETTTLGIRSVNSQWAGLRTFAPDRELVIGEDPEVPGFYWLVGQGGSGVMTAPAYGALLASQVAGTDMPIELATAGLDPTGLDPGRFQ
ncbi:MAG: FAD-binding oxidoreductase [Actinomycetota bacterium]|nr:FAD-binding oxidoreductase [Actinomycetota bacterium]